MNYWLVSDTHFNHSKLSEWGDRSGDWQEQLLKGLSAISQDDMLIHLGDICIGNDEEVHQMLFEDFKDDRAVKAGRSILIRGNHDKKSFQWYTEHGWDFVCDGLELVYMGHYLHLTHRPARPQGNNTYNIHGHTHGNLHRAEEYVEFYNADQYHIDISPELIGFTPIRLDTLMKKRQQFERVLRDKKKAILDSASTGESHQAN